MFCESYEQRLKDAASCGALPPSLERHVAECASCRKTLTRERELLGSIDSALRARANTEIPPSLVARVREAVSVERAPRKLMYARTLLWPVAVCAVALFAVRSYVREPAIVPKPAVISVTTAKPAAALASSGVPAPQPRNRNVSPTKRNVPVRAVQFAPKQQTEDERSIRDLLKLARQRPEIVASFIKSAPTETPIEIQPIEVAELDWKPVVIVPAKAGKSEPNR